MRFENIRLRCAGRFKWVAWAVLSMASVNALANPSENLHKLLSATQSMTANFSQTTKGAKTTTFSGTMAVARPNQFRWHISSPSSQLIVANDNTLWVYDKDLAQATRQSTRNQVGETPALLLSGNVNTLKDNFIVTQPNAPKNYYVLTPKDANASFKNLALSFNGGRPVMMVLNDNLGQTTTIQFSNIKMNPKIAASQFDFTPPDGTDVIDQ